MRLVLCWLVVLSLVPRSWSADPVLPRTDLTLLDTHAVPLVEGPNDVNIARITARILHTTHYLRPEINDQLASKFLDRYLESLDNLHIYFTQADLEEFRPYRTTLDDLTFKDGDTAPARKIFRRFRERVEEQYQFAVDALKTRTFEFEGDERYVINRRELPRPKDLEEAKEFWWQRLRYEYLQEKLNQTKPDEIVNIIYRRYTRLVRSLREYDNDDVLQLYLTSLAHVCDPHSDYFGAPELENFSIGMKLSLFGIGALLRSENGYCKIQSLVAAGPAERSKKIKANDKIIAVAQGEGEPVDVIDMKLRKVVDLIRGPKGSEVRLTIIPADAEDSSVRKVVPLVREEIKLEDQAAKAKLIEFPCTEGGNLRLGVIDLPSFYATFDLEGEQQGGERRSTTSDVAKLLAKLMEQKVDGVILDLRRNGGGSLEEAINLTGLFIKEGTVVRVKDSNNKVYDENDTDPAVLYDGPLVVLTSRFSASASEILAGALQDCQRALIVGDSSTHGKGTVQSLIQLKPIMRSHGLNDDPDPGALKITIRKFYRPSGESTQLRGVVPEIILPSINNHADVGESSLTNPLEWDRIEPGDYTKLGRVAPYLAELRTRSEARRAKSEDFAYVQQEIARYEKAIADKTVGMNEAKRRKEKEEADARAKARKKELAARKPPTEVIYEISLHQASEPGLPEPVSAKEKEPAKPETAANTTTTTEAEDEDPTVPDIYLQEAQSILADYVTLTSKDHELAHVTK